MGDWTFFSNHGHVLVCLARDHDARLRDVATQVGITERAVQKIVRDLQDEGFLEVAKHGRRNRYRINNRKALRHPLQSGCTVGQLLGLLTKTDGGKRHRPKESPSRKDRALKAKTPPSQPQRESQSEPQPESRPDAPEPKPTKSPDTGERPPDRDLEQGQLF